MHWIDKHQDCAEFAGRPKERKRIGRRRQEGAHNIVRKQHSIFSRRLGALCSVLACAGCSVAQKNGIRETREDSGHSRTIHIREIQAVLESQEAAWNRGDVNGFMQGYWNSPFLTFSSGGKIQRGWQETMDRYRTTYPNRETMGQLKFDDLDALALGSDHALVTGSWLLEREEPVGGVFSLIFRRLPEGWRIIHDHTSVLEPTATVP